MTTESAQPIKHHATQPRSPGSSSTLQQFSRCSSSFPRTSTLLGQPGSNNDGPRNSGLTGHDRMAMVLCTLCLIGRRIIRDTPYQQDPSWQSKPQRTPAVSRIADRPPGAPSRLRHPSRSPGRKAASAACTDRPAEDGRQYAGSAFPMTSPLASRSSARLFVLCLTENPLEQRKASHSLTDIAPMSLHDITAHQSALRYRSCSTRRLRGIIEERGSTPMREHEPLVEAVTPLAELAEKVPTLEGVPTGVPGLDELFFVTEWRDGKPMRRTLGGIPRYAVLQVTGVSDTGKSLMVEQFAVEPPGTGNAASSLRLRHLGLLSRSACNSAPGLWVSRSTQSIAPSS